MCASGTGGLSCGDQPSVGSLLLPYAVASGFAGAAALAAPAGAHAGNGSTSVLHLCYQDTGGMNERQLFVAARWRVRTSASPARSRSTCPSARRCLPVRQDRQVRRAPQVRPVPRARRVRRATRVRRVRPARRVPLARPARPGATGSPGPKGDTGAQGPQGVKGDTGATGAQGRDRGRWVRRVRRV